MIETFDEDELPAHLAWQAVAYMREAWPSLFAGGLAWITRPAPVEARPRHFVVSHRGVLVSYASVIELTVTQGGEDFSAYGLGNVLTASPYRRRGHATRVLAAVNRWLDWSDGDLAGLFCGPHLTSFYARVGWTDCPGGTRVGRRGTAYGEVRMMRFLSDRGRAARTALVREPIQVPHPW